MAGLVGDDAQVVRGAYAASAVVTRWVIVPLGFAALVTGIVQSLGTAWGLFRHYRVLVKLLLTVVATALLLLHTQPVEFMADVVASTPIAPDEYRRVRIQLVFDAGAAILVLLANTVLSIYKPRGMTAHGQRRQHAERLAESP